MEIYGEYGPYVVWVQGGGEGKRSTSAKSSYHNGIYTSQPRVYLSFDEKPISKMVYPEFVPMRYPAVPGLWS